MHWKVLIILFFAATAYLLIGAIGFHYIERSTEETRQAEMQMILTNFTNQYPCVEFTNLTRLFSIVVNAYAVGYRLGANGSVVAPAPKWSYPSSVFFAMTVITTIGYGNLAPSTVAGRAFCCVYAVVGIPLLAILLSGLTEWVKVARHRVENCQCWRDKGRLAKIITGVLYFLLGFLCFVIIPALVFSAIEGWTLSDGVYYGFITLTTIGFGDFVAGQKASTSVIYKLSLTLWIFLGLVFMSGVISTLQGIIELGTKQAETKVLHSGRQPTDEADAKDENDDEVKSNETKLEDIVQSTGTV